MSDVEIILSKYIPLMAKEVSDPEILNITEELYNHLITLFECDINVFITFADMYQTKEYKQNIDGLAPGLTDFVSDTIWEYCVRNM